jgi:hypothetical protein
MGFRARQLQAMHGGQVMVSTARVLDLLNPRGMWRYVSKAAEPADEGELDPVTGCKPVTAQQSEPGNA